jgi:hypothetical protein
MDGRDDFIIAGLPHPSYFTRRRTCPACGRTLTAEASVRRGFGPVCWNRGEKWQMKLEFDEERA